MMMRERLVHAVNDVGKWMSEEVRGRETFRGKLFD